MARLSAAKSHLHPRSVGWHGAAALLRFTSVMSPGERWSPKKILLVYIATLRRATRYLVVTAPEWR